LSVGAELLHLLANDNGLLTELNFGLAQDSLLRVLDELGNIGGIRENSVAALLRLASSLGQEDKLFDEGLESVHVSLNRFDGLVGASVVDGDTNSSGEAGVDLSLTQFLESETTAKSGLTAVASSGLVNDGAKSANGAREDGGGLFLTLLKTAVLAGGLVEPGLDPLGVVLAKMRALDGVVVSWHL